MQHWFALVLKYYSHVGEQLQWATLVCIDLKILFRVSTRFGNLEMFWSFYGHCCYGNIMELRLRINRGRFHMLVVLRNFVLCTMVVNIGIKYILFSSIMEYLTPLLISSSYFV